MCDVKSKYVCGAILYHEKNTNPSGLPLGMFFIKKLTRTRDTKDILDNHKLTILGAMRSDR